MSTLSTTLLIMGSHAETMSAIDQGLSADLASGAPRHATRWHADRLTLHGFPFAGDLPAATFDDLVYTFEWIDEAWCNTRSSEGEWMATDRAWCTTCRRPYFQCTCWVAEVAEARWGAESAAYQAGL